MNTAKLKEALTELKSERSVIDAAIKNLEVLIRSVHEASSASTNGVGSYIDLVVFALETSGKPLNMKALTLQVSERRGEPIARKNIEASLFRHRQVTGDRKRVEKVGPAYYALPEWSDDVKDSWKEGFAA